MLILPLNGFVITQNIFISQDIGTKLWIKYQHQMYNNHQINTFRYLK